MTSAQDQRLRGRVAVVTGAARGIGEAIALRLAQEGAWVTIADVRGQLAEHTAERMAKEGHHVESFTTDISDPASVDALAAHIDARHGRLDILVNNAALVEGDTGLGSIDWTAHSRFLDVNVTGTMRVTARMLPLLRKSPHQRRILNISSITAIRAQRGMSSYPATKAAVAGFTLALAADLADEGITVNAIAPGYVATAPDGESETEWFHDLYVEHGLIFQRRTGQPLDIAGPAYFLCSDDSAYVTGQILSVDGGLTAAF